MSEHCETVSDVSHSGKDLHLSAQAGEHPVICVVGQPNSGKTTLFNALTGSNYKTSNYPGATVEYSLGSLASKYNFKAVVVDTPGIISLTPESPDEVVTVNSLYNHPRFGLPDVVILATDSTQLSRQLYPVKQMIDAGFNVIVALTMHDLLEHKGFRVDTNKLSSKIGAPCFIVDGRKGRGIPPLINAVSEITDKISRNELSKEINRIGFPTEKDVLEIYHFTEAAEKESVIPFSEKNNIEAVNRKYFDTSRKLTNQTLRLDKFFLHPFWGLLIFIVSMGIIFTSIFWLAQPLMDLIDSGFGLLSDSVATILPADTWYSDLITKGIINGVGSVMVFLPQIIILFIFLGLLEDTGYLARAAMLVDKPLTMFGLNGRSFVPMLSGYACAIPAIMSSRTITNRRERMLTIFIIPLMSCSARLPVYALLLAFVIPPDKPWIGGIALGALYLFSIISGAVVAGIISKFKKPEEKSTFMLELPAYRLPVLKHVYKNTIHKASSYIKGAGPTIILISLILWTITYFPDIHPEINAQPKGNLSAEQQSKLLESIRLNNSYASKFGKIIEPVLAPLGWDWRVGVSLISAFAAREVFVSSMAITMSITESNEDNLQTSILNSMREAKINSTGKPLFTTASTISLIIYFMFAMQCLSTAAVSRKETGGWKIPVMQTILYTVMAYVFAFISFNGLKALGVE